MAAVQTDLVEAAVPASSSSCYFFAAVAEIMDLEVAATTTVAAATDLIHAGLSSCFCYSADVVITETLLVTAVDVAVNPPPCATEPWGCQEIDTFSP